MENENKYIWSNLKKGAYSQITSDITSEVYNTIPFKNIVISDEALILNFYKSYTKIIIPKEIESLLKSLLSKYGLTEYFNEFIVLSCASQKSFIDNMDTKEEMKNDVLLQDFNNTKKDYTEFLKIIEMYLFSGTKNNIHTISFKPYSSPTVPIKNFFVLNDIYDAICKGLGITKENFSERKEKILNLANNIPVNLYSEMVKTSIVTSLYRFILKCGNKKSDSLRFVGCFLHISQIPTNSKEIDFFLDDDIAFLLKSIDIKNLSHYINRPKKFIL
jgi:hypothetical protein